MSRFWFSTLRFVEIVSSSSWFVMFVKSPLMKLVEGDGCGEEKQLQLVRITRQRMKEWGNAAIEKCVDVARTDWFPRFQAFVK